MGNNSRNHIFILGVRSCPHHGTECCDYEDDEYFYSDDEYYDYSEEESEDEFLDTIAHRYVCDWLTDFLLKLVQKYCVQCCRLHAGKIIPAI